MNMVQKVRLFTKFYMPKYNKIMEDSQMEMLVLGAPGECWEIINRNISSRIAKDAKKLGLSIGEIIEQLEKNSRKAGTKEPPESFFHLIFLESMFGGAG